MLAKFDPVIQKHVKRIKDKETHVHYLGHRIQDELIEIMANEVRKSIINLIKKHRYYSVIIDCTPDISHQEQVSLVFRIVNMHWDESTEPSIETKNCL